MIYKLFTQDLIGHLYFEHSLNYPQANYQAKHASPIGDIFGNFSSHQMGWGPVLTKSNLETGEVNLTGLLLFEETFRQ